MTIDHARRHSAPSGRESLRQQLRSGFRKCLGLTALGTALPGAGLTQTRARRLGWTILIGFLLTVAAVAYVVLTRGVTKTGLLVISRPSYLTGITIAMVVGGLIWCASIVATAVQARPRWLDRTRTRTLALFTTVMVALIGGSAYKGAEFALITKDTISEVFASAPQKPGEGAKVILDEPDVDPWRDTPRVNILLIGSDAGEGRDGTRTDSMIVASIDTKSGRALMIQLPRSLEQAPLSKDSPLLERYPSGFFGVPNSSCTQGSHTCFLTNLWREAEFYKHDHPESYPGDDNPGRTENRRTIQLITGLKIDHEVIIDLKGFSELIDAMGGIDVNIKLGGYDGQQALPYGVKRADGSYSASFDTPGLRHLDGYRALWYARTRAADDDTKRQSRQRCVVRAIVGQVNPAEMLSKYADVAQIARDNIYTDIPVQNLPAFVDLIERVQKARISSLPLTPEKGIYGGAPDYALIRTLVHKAVDPAPSNSPATPSVPPTGAASGATSTTHSPKPTTTTAETDECA